MLEMTLAHAIAVCSNCLIKVGAVLNTGGTLTYASNQIPNFAGSCVDAGHCNKSGDNCKTSGLPSKAIHAEILCVNQAIESGLTVLGSTIYVTSKPCFPCTKFLLAFGVHLIVYQNGFILEVTPIKDLYKHYLKT